MSDDRILFDEPEPLPTAPYRVLARKYRPAAFDELIGQDALVRTLTNAFAQGRIAHAFMLTGVRGVGKTTTARIIARALNCIGPDGKGGPTITPCGVCPNCVAIAADRHVDVLEMDAASRTGIDDIRELIDGVRYAPGAGRYKVYIVDEVHMLSKQAFNALLKTLEEPPPHVKFVFATTEIRKVPVTVLSRCQRFDLRRVDQATLVAHFDGIAAKEGAAVEPAAMALIARAADGSVRDGLSLLDQAIALGGGRVEAGAVRDMLGLADRAVVLDLFEATLSGDAPAALAILRRLHQAGADPVAVVEDLLETTHALACLRAAPDTARNGANLEPDRLNGLAARLGIPALTRTWQLLLKGLAEVQTAPGPQAAAEMVILRLIHAAELPSPADLIRQLRAGSADGGSGVPAGGREAVERGRPVGLVASGRNGAVAIEAEPAPVASPDEAVLALSPPAERLPDPRSFRDVVQLFATRREALLEYHLAASARLVRFEPGIIELNPLPAAPANLANRVGSLLSDWTGRRWVVGISSEAGQPTLRASDEARRAQSFDEAQASPTVRAIMDAFPGAVISDVRDLGGPDLPAGSDPSDLATGNGDEP